MKVAVAQVDGKWPNLALAKLCKHHRGLGHEVEIFNPLFSDSYDTVYASKVFMDTPDSHYLPARALTGGAGYRSGECLPPWVEELRPDWSLWPWWSKDMGFTTRGCVRRCPFCSVPDREGKLHVVASLPEISTGRRDMVLLDANICGAPMEHFRQVFSDAKRLGIRLDPSQGIDARLLTEEQARIILDTPHGPRLHTAFDHPRDEKYVRRAIALFREAGMNIDHDLLVFVLIGWDTTPEEDLERVELVRSLGANPFVMPYDRSIRYQIDFSRWVNRVPIFRTTTWTEYRRRRDQIPSGADVAPDQLSLG